MSDTPRADAVDAKCNELELKDAVFYAIFHFEKLERELNAANDRIKRLESKLVQIDKWHKAKEAKP
jgi:predicted  nucleic acid-binding Zn-ribbon protein